MDKKENIEIISGDGSNLNISPVYEHLEPEKPKSKDKPKNIVIPEDKKSNISDKNNK